MNRFVVISGCSGGGKSTLLAELGTRGYAIVEEPGRRIVREEIKHDGRVLPWIDAEAFARRAVEMSRADRATHCDTPDWVFFDRGLIDASAALQHVTGMPVLKRLKPSDRYNSSVFLAPPWPEIYAADEERRHDLSEAIAEYERLHAAYEFLRYETHILPKTDVKNRADFVLATLGA